MPDRSITAQAEEGLSIPVELEELEALVASVLDAEGVQDAELSVALLSDAEIASLNEEYLSHEGPTDVITFPLHRPGGSPLGDVYIGAEQAARQAEEAGVGYREELLRLTVHGTLHVLGYEHPAGPDREGSPMYLRQEELLAAFLARSSDRGGARG